MDTVTRESRSHIMSAIHGSNTKPELFIRGALFSRGFRFRINSRDLPGRPDLKLTKHGAVILVHGCFWHGHDCRFFRPPSSNVAFWSEKIARNRSRDLRDVKALHEAGWRVCVAWECAVCLAMLGKDRGKLLDKLEAWIKGDRTFVEFFDSSATNGGKGGKARSGKAAIARNASAGKFAAEREPPYGASKGSNR